MTDIYVGHKKKSPAGCFVLLIVLVAVVAALVYWIWFRHKPAPPPPAPTSSQSVSPASTAETALHDPGLGLLEKAQGLRDKRKFLEARDAAYDVMDKSSNEVARAGAEALLGEVNIELVFTPRAMPEKSDYTVQPGDSIDQLAKKFGTTVDVIRKGNRVVGSVIRVGDRLRIFSGKFSIRVDKSNNTLTLFLNDRFFKRYSVGTGEYGKTPAGSFSIREKIPQPTWWRPDGQAVPYGDTNNVLGTYWLSLDIPGYGIHGTWQPDTIGKQSSAGCIRLLNAEIEELYMLVPVGTPVVIVD